MQIDYQQKDMFSKTKLNLIVIQEIVVFMETENLFDSICSEKRQKSPKN